MYFRHYIHMFRIFRRAAPLAAFILLSTSGVGASRIGQQASEGLQTEEGALYLLFAEDGVVRAQEFLGERNVLLEALSIEDAIKLSGLPQYDVYDVSFSPLGLSASDDEFGFFHGVWSPDRSSFAWLELKANSAEYRVRVFEDGVVSDYIDDRISESRGYLDPLVWTKEGRLLLSERYFVDRFDAGFRVWELDLLSGNVLLSSESDIPSTMGRSLVVPDAPLVLIGLSNVTHEAYLYDPKVKLTWSFSVGLDPTSVEESNPANALPTSFSTGLENLSTDTSLFPIGFVRGAANAANKLELSRIGDAIDSVTPTDQRPAPFLYWPLPDSIRHIWKYPDSPWTAANKPGQTYRDHQGTDIAALPSATGAEVYASAPGVITSVYNQCPDHTRDFSGGADTPPRNCNIINDNDGDGWGKHNWGNSVIIAHNVVVNGNARVWYSGYGHLMKDSIPGGLAVGTEVCRGLKVGLLGHTGNSYGPHLHFEIRNGNSYRSWDDPWGSSDPPYGASLWAGGNGRPLGAKDNTTCGCCGCSSAWFGASLSELGGAQYGPSSLELGLHVAYSDTSATRGFAEVPPYLPPPNPISGQDTREKGLFTSATGLANQTGNSNWKPPTYGLSMAPGREANQGIHADSHNATGVKFAPASSSFGTELSSGLPASGNYRVIRSVMSMAGGAKSSTSYRLLSTLGQAFASGSRFSSSYRLSSGYWGSGTGITPTSTPTPSATPTGTPTPTRTATPTMTATGTVPATRTSTPTATFTPSPTPSIPAPLSTPLLSNIDNADSDGYYPVEWTTSETALSYELQEQPAGWSWLTIYQGSSTWFFVSEKAEGVWCYRVRALGAADTSDWSETKCTVVGGGQPQMGAYLPLIVRP